MKHLLCTLYLILTSLLSFGQTAVSSYSFTGNANDDLGDNNGVVHGATLTEDRFGNPNSAYQFDGIDDYINFGDSSEFRLTTSYSFSAWVYIEDVLGQNVGPVLVKRNPNFPYNQYNLAVTSDIQFGGNGNMIHYLHKGDVNATSRVLTSPSLTVGWHHLAIVHSTTDLTLKMYFDNTLVFMTSVLEPTLEVVGRPFEIGGNLIGNNFFKGKIDDVTLYHDTLSAADVTTLYNQTGIADCLVAEYTFDNSSIADAIGSKDVSLGGASFGVDRGGNANNSLKVDGHSSDQVPSIAHQIIDPNDDFTVSYWVNVDSFNTPDNYQYFVSSRHDAVGAEVGGLDMGVNQAGEFSCVLRTTTNALATIVSPVQISNRWQHVVAVRDNDSLKFYIDDILIGVDEINTGTMNFPSFWTLGSNYNPGPIVFRELSGRLDDFRFYCRALSAAEIVNLHPLSTSKTSKSPTLNWTLYPNPTNGLLNIHLEEFVEGSLQIINVTGQVIHQETLQSNNHQLDIRNLNTGIYFVRLMDENGAFSIQKIIKE